MPDGGTAWRLDEAAPESGRAGADKLREPRLPLDPPPPARAQASTDHNTMARNITLKAVKVTDRCMVHSFSKLIDILTHRTHPPEAPQGLIARCQENRLHHPNQRV
jgi:hypothetical protein